MVGACCPPAIVGNRAPARRGQPPVCRVLVILQLKETVKRTLTSGGLSLGPNVLLGISIVPPALPILASPRLYTRSLQGQAVCFSSDKKHFGFGRESELSPPGAAGGDKSARLEVRTAPQGRSMAGTSTVEEGRCCKG